MVKFITYLVVLRCDFISFYHIATTLPVTLHNTTALKYNDSLKHPHDFSYRQCKTTCWLNCVYVPTYRLIIS